jgi:O-antigen/teichoic acid export membrane protein
MASIASLRKFLFFVGVCLTCGLFLLAPELTLFVLGDQYRASIPLLRILSVVPVLIALSEIFGTQILLTFNHHRAFSRAFIAGGVSCLAALFVLTPHYLASGAATSVILAELVVAILMMASVKSVGLMPSHAANVVAS